MRHIYSKTVLKPREDVAGYGCWFCSSGCMLLCGNSCTKGCAICDSACTSDCVSDANIAGGGW